jgi:hypothetical protein
MRSWSYGRGWTRKAPLHDDNARVNFLNADHIFTFLSPMRAAGMSKKTGGRGKQETLLTNLHLSRLKSWNQAYWDCSSREISQTINAHPFMFHTIKAHLFKIHHFLSNFQSSINQSLKCLIQERGTGHSCKGQSATIKPMEKTEYAQLTPWSWALLEKLPVVHPHKNFPTFYGTRRFLTVFTRALHWSLSWARLIQSIPAHPTSL